MGEEVKKISFGFSKIAKKTSIVSSKVSEPTTDDNKVELIDCLEGKSIKLKDPIKCKNSVLVIPLKKESKDSCVNKERDCISVVDKKPEVECISNVPSIENHQVATDISNEDSIVVKKETLDEIAAREIVQDLNKQKVEEENHVFSVPLTSNAPIGEAQSSLDDYENIPVSQFGLAMLRGMGWAPGKGIGKNEKLVTPSLPALRPKGMGLGADKVIKAAVENGMTNDKDLKMAKGSFVRIIAGVHKDCYGQIEGFDDESCRMIVKLALKNISVSLNEFMTQLVDKHEFTKNSKVINMGKYEKYKDDEKNETPEQSKRDEKDRGILNERDFSKHLRYSKSSMSTSYKRSNTPDRKKDHSSRNHKTDSKSNVLEHEFYNSRKIRRSRSSSRDQQSSSDSDYSDRKKHRIKKKKPSSHRHKSRTRSRSPKHHRSHKKHK